MKYSEQKNQFNVDKILGKADVRGQSREMKAHPPRELTDVAQIEKMSTILIKRNTDLGVQRATGTLWG